MQSTYKQLTARFLIGFSLWVSVGLSQTIQTVAGGGPEPGTNTASYLPGPVGIATDTAGNFYISSSVLCQVYQSTPNGVFTVVAGNQSCKFSGEGRPAAMSSLNGAAGIAVDSQGNVYIADSVSRILKVDSSTGVLTTVAGRRTAAFGGDGGPARRAFLANPGGVAVDLAGNLYILDTANFRVRRVDAATGIISTIAGTGKFGYSGDGGPAVNADIFAMGIAADAAGNVYLADTYNERVRRVDVKTGFISTLAGNGSGGYGGDGGPALAATLDLPQGIAVDASGDVFIADTNNCRIRRIDARTGVIRTIAGDRVVGYEGDGGPAPRAALNLPVGVAVDSQGDTFLADSLNNRIRRVDASSKIITTVAGGGSGGDGGPATSGILNAYEIAIDAAGDVWMADYADGRVRKLDASSGTISTVAGIGIWGFSGDSRQATQASLYAPTSVAVDAAGNVYVIDSGDGHVRKVNASTGIIKSVAGTGIPVFCGDGGPATQACINGCGVALDGAGNLYIADTFNNRIRKVDKASGVINTIAGNGMQGFCGDGGPAVSACLSFPFAVAVDNNGNVFIADTGNERVRRLDASSNVITSVAGIGEHRFCGDGRPAVLACLANPAALAVDAGGNVFIADSANQRIRRVDAQSGIITTVAGDGVPGFRGDGGSATQARLYDPNGVAIDTAGTLFISDGLNNRIRAVTPAPSH